MPDVAAQTNRVGSDLSDTPNLRTRARHADGVVEEAAPLRLLLVCSHVVQYASPIFRQMARDRRFDVVVAYCSMQGAEAGIDPGFGVQVSWDQPQLEGYRWIHPSNRAWRPAVDHFAGLWNPGLWPLIRDGDFDAVWLSGYFYASAWIAMMSALWHRVPILFTTDGHDLRTWATQSPWRQKLKKFLVRRILGLGRIVLAGSSGTIAYLKSLGIPENRILLGRNIVDNDWWTNRAAEISRQDARERWQIPTAASVVLFCAKLQPWKGPQDLLEAFARANLSNGYLVFAGDGSLRGSLEKRAAELGIPERVRFLGFLNQSQLPSIYRAADVMVLPSLYEPFGLVVNEAMLCGCPVAVSDRVGAKFDLVRQGETGWIFPCGNVDALKTVLSSAFARPAELAEMGEAARHRMESWSPREYLNSLAEAVRLARVCKP